MFLDQQGRVVTSASDLTAASACEFSWLRRLDERLGRLEPLERTEDAMLRRAAELGDAHEERVLADYDDGTRTVVRIERPDVRDPASVAAAVAATQQAFAEGAAVVFQATFWAEDDHGLPFVGFADFIVRSPDGRCRVQDSKLARSAKVTALLQLAAYAGQMRRAGVAVDEQVDLILGDGTLSTHRLKDLEPIYALRRRRLAQLVRQRLADTPPADWEDEGIARCGACEDCAAQIAERRDMWQVYRLTGAQRTKLRSVGLRTLDDVAAWQDGDPTGGVPRRTVARLAGQAALQVASEGRDVPEYRVTDPTVLAALPAPSEGDLFFDFEGDPLWTPDGQQWGLDYLFGLVDDQGRFTAFWAHDLAQERQALLDFLDFVEERRRRWPDLHIYHYAAYERTHLSSIAQRHGAGEDRVDELLRQQVLVDLYGVVGGALQLGTPSYSIKKVEALHMAGEHREGVTSAVDSVDQYAQVVLLREAGREDEAQELLQQIADYNEYDCLSTLRLRDWLRQVAAAHPVPGDPAGESPARGAGASPAGSAPVEKELTEEQREAREQAERERAELEAALLELGGDPALPGRSPQQRAWGLARAALDFHRREEKNYWWEHYARLSGPEDEWAQDRNVFHVESLEVTRDWSKKPRARTLSRDLVLRGQWSEGSTPKAGEGFLVYDFPGPHLIHGAESGMRDDVTVEVTSAGPAHPDTVHITEATTTKRPATHDRTPRALTPGAPPKSAPLQAAIGTWVREAVGTGQIPQDPLGDLLLRRPSRLRSGGLAPVEGEDVVGAVVDSVLRLERSYLAVQGPPGTGKTYLAAHVILALVKRHGWRVGVVAQSHAVVDNVLTGVIRHGLDPDRVIKVQSRDQDAPEGVEQVMEPRRFVEAADGMQEGYVVGGIAWLFARPEVAVDLLIVDEAGQFSLANTIAAGTGARNLLLCGDPQQLPQVSQGTHPEPVDTSALGHLSEGHDVLPAQFGYFLAQSRRMDAAVTAPVSELSYEGRLRSHASTERRLLDGVEPGLETVFVEHHGNITSSPEEAQRVVELVRQHLGALWTEDDGGPVRPLGQRDVIVVTPYNAQVQTLQRTLSAAGLAEVRVGTVDRFQGQEAVLSITSLAASSAVDVPRGLGFLLMRNRLNVSVSRAQWKAFLVCSPELLEHLPSTPQGLGELSAFARLTGLA